MPKARTSGGKGPVHLHQQDGQKAPRIRRTDKAVRERCLRLLKFCRLQFASGNGVRYGQVKEHKDFKDLYEDSDEFRDDCKKIEDGLNDVRDWLEELGFPVPPMTYHDRQLSTSVRPLDAQIVQPRPELTPLAESLVEFELRGNFLVPRHDTVYFGFGATILAVVEYLCQQELKERFAILTDNLAILVRHFVAVAARQHILLAGGRVNWEQGCIVRDNKEQTNHHLNSAASVISFAKMNTAGQFFADNPVRLEAICDALSRTRERIILVGDDSKFTDAGPNSWEIPLKEFKAPQIYLFSNRKPAKEFQVPSQIKTLAPRRSTASRPSNPR